MNTTSRRMQDTSGLSADVPREFVAVDDSGDFSYHRSEQDLLTAFEYPGEAACIIDRGGSAYRLALDPNRQLVLGPTLGPVEFHWLRDAWLEAQKAHPKEHRLRRFYPATRNEVVSGLFEALALESGTAPAPGEWSLDMDGFASHAPTLHEVDRRLAGQGRLEHARVQDPFGHLYRPARHRQHRFLPHAAGSVLYIEIPATH